jgi:SNF2 family DNA or RNA helicase
MSEKEAEEFFNSLGDKFAYCNVEWLVKWKDLGYEYATWELETSSFLCTPEAKDLKRNYESRHEDARRGFDPAKINKGKQCLFQKLQKLPDGFPPGLDKDHLSSLNRLREFWHNSDGAICLDDQERVIKTILFSMSILPDVCQPLLIVSTSASLSLWEAKFNRLAPSINVVVYNGEKDVRKQIQDLEFYENGLVTFQVLLSHPDAILEDIQTMESIVWEAVMVDDCQSLRVSKCLEQLKHLSTNFRMVLLSFPLKVLLATVTCRIIFTLFPQTGNVNSFCFAGEYS